MNNTCGNCKYKKGHFCERQIEDGYELLVRLNSDKACKRFINKNLDLKHDDDLKCS